jgi:hypothetical protein
VIYSLYFYLIPQGIIAIWKIYNLTLSKAKKKFFKWITFERIVGYFPASG